MASIIPEYNYDIFISYRQKDNKGDRWVSQFVEALKTELEATFKEDVSVYFDENPHDRLQETHDVGKSLEGKLKCLIFIPVISQTYCDPKSYAWQSEFLPFLRMAEKDRFGKDIKLRSGNVASRIMPVRIHDLEQEDIKLFENATGGVMRAIDFLFRTATGVSRPLKPNEDHPQDNINNTFYADQINKAGHAIKEIILGIKRVTDEDVKEKIPSVITSEQVISKEGVSKISKPVQGKIFNRNTVSISLIALVLIILGFLFIPRLLKPEEEIEKSIAVLPFVNLSNDPEQDWFSDGIVDAILNHLFKVGDLKVKSSTSTKKYKNTDLSIREIARELGVSSILEGSVQKIGDDVRITTQLIDARTDAHLWSEIYDRNISDILAIESEVAQKVALELKATLTSEEKEKIEKNATENIVAYNLYLQGRFHIKNRIYNDYIKSIEYFEKAVALDKEYTLAYAGLADAYFLLAWHGHMSQQEAYAKSREYVNIALGIDKNCAEAHTVLGGILTFSDWNWEEARKELQLAIELNPNFIPAHSYYSELLDLLRENTEARRQIDIALELDPFFPMMRALSAIFYYHEGKFEQAIDERLMIIRLDPESNQYLSIYYNYAMLGDDQKAIDALEQYLLRGDSLSLKYAGMLNNESARSDIKEAIGLLIKMQLERQDPPALSLAGNYALTGNREETLNWLETAFTNRTSSLPRINNDPRYEFLRSDPRFQSLLAKMGLSEYQIPK